MSTAVAQDGFILRSLAKVGRIAIFFAEMLVQCVRVLVRPSLVIAQIFNAGGRSLVIIMLSGLFTGMVLALLGFTLLQRFGSGEALGFATALALLKELGPVLTALLFAGRAGTALTSEIGLMRATDQLTAMQMMAVDPLRFVVAPRFLGGLISMPLLTAVYDVVGLFGAHTVGVRMMGVDNGSFWSQMQSAVSLHDVNEGIVKSLVFGFICSLIAVYEGYHADPTAEGVGLATTRTVVASSVLILLLDYMLTAAFI
jgi:phospholipid/cholesterol/gamma-HCH transport system permease protein